MKKFFYLVIMLIYAPLAQAQEVGIAAIVGNDIISSADVENRIHLINVSQQTAGQEKIDKSLRPQVVEMLIAERLYRQEAKRLKFSLSDEEVANAIRIVEERNQMQPGGMEKLLSKQGVPYSTFKDQLEAQLLWNKVINAQIRPKIKVTDEEVKNTKENLPVPTKPKITEVLISEIALPIEPGNKETDMKSLALKVVREIRAGKSFAVAAQQYSKSPTALTGGKVGWIIEQAIPPELAKTVKQLKDGQVSDAIRSEKGYYIVKVEGRRDALSKEQYAVKVQLKQVFVPIANDTASNKVQQEKDKLLALAKNIRTCKDFDDVIAKAMPSEPLGALEVAIKDIQPDLQNTLLKQAVNGGASVVRSVSGLHLVTICGRGAIPPAVEEKPVVMDESTVREMLMQKKIEGQARHYLQNLRRKAEIDIR